MHFLCNLYIRFVRNQKKEKSKIKMRTTKFMECIPCKEKKRKRNIQQLVGFHLICYNVNFNAVVRYSKIANWLLYWDSCEKTFDTKSCWHNLYTWELNKNLNNSKIQKYNIAFVNESLSKMLNVYEFHVLELSNCNNIKIYVTYLRI